MGARACRAGPDQHLVHLARGDDLIDQRIDSRAAAVVTLCREIASRLRQAGLKSAAAFFSEGRVSQRSLIKPFELQRGACHGISL
jgi:hypothetical protein